MNNITGGHPNSSVYAYLIQVQSLFSQYMQMKMQLDMLNNNVEETKIMQAYGLTVYGKINRYVWTLEGNREENALINIKIIT